MSRRPCCSAIFLTNLVITKHSGCSQTLRLEAGSLPVPLAPTSPQSLPHEAGSAGFRNDRMISSLVMNQRGRLHMNHPALRGDLVLPSLYSSGSGWADAQELRVCPWAEGSEFLISCDNSEVLHRLLNPRGMLPRFNNVTSSWSWFSSRKCHIWPEGKIASWQ